MCRVCWLWSVIRDEASIHVPAKHIGDEANAAVELRQRRRRWTSTKATLGWRLLLSA